VTDRITRRELNRATLARQLLLERSTTAPLEAVRHLVGLQAQAPWAPYHQLLCRLDDVVPDDIGQLLMRRELVRISAMRGTIHLMTAADAVAIRPLVQVVLDRMLGSNKDRREALEGVDLDAVAAAGEEMVATEVLTPAELGERLVASFPGVAPEALATVVRAKVAVVQATPRAVWGRQGAPRLTALASWVTEAGVDASAASMPLDELVRRYLTAFGPASVRDVQTWSGLTRLDRVVAGMAADLVTFTGEDGIELHDLPDAPRPGGDVDAPPRLIGEFDDLILSHADRRRVVPEDHRRRLATRNGMQPATVLVDGEVSGVWRITREGPAAVVAVEAWGPVPRRARAGLEAEGERLLALVAPEVDDRDVRITGP
jgi:hypothetical protein